jgi:hypothetical protein
MPSGKFGNYYGMPNSSFCTPTAPTLPERYRTWNIGNPSVKGDFTRFHPWRSPGRAPVSDPCGVSGGYLIGVKAAPRAVGSTLGDKGSQLPPVKGVKTIWFANHAEEVGFMLGKYKRCVQHDVVALTSFCHTLHSTRRESRRRVQLCKQAPSMI